MIDVEKFVSFYNNKFKPVYSDLVAYISDKPQQIIIEQENALSHLMVYLDENQDKNVRNKNLEKAYNHILRATLDSYKLLWVEINSEIDEIFKDDTKRLSLSMNVSLFLQKRNDFKEKAKIARKKEMEAIGIDINTSLNLYKEAIDTGWELIKSIDPHKEIEVKKYRKKWNYKNITLEIIIGFIVGVITTLTTQYITQNKLYQSIFSFFHF